MVIEIAEFTAAPGRGDELLAGLQRGVEVIRSAEGCIAARAAQSLEDPQACVLIITWRRIEDHLETFRKGPLFEQYRQHIAGLFAGEPRVRHYPTDE
jgi:quinol monooxygenase YgiN